MAIDDLRNGTYAVESMTLDEASANVFDGFAVAFTNQGERSTNAGDDTSGLDHYANVWTMRDGQWQVVSSHGTRYDEGH